ncbi:Topoisomerase 1-associated factor 1 [Malassezia yamatoensis]|uniref:Topoisomerase 1-associated factor 1 n=1 Tax=Malassezia yamatoensis TaxID=253288 RepID=A0AAJ5YUY5_9BASI|nr:Topoisomerase 1-associated factor 1 [Malassezia yamatoensis]
MEVWDEEGPEDWYASDVASSAEDSAEAQEEASETSEVGEIDHDERSNLLRPPILSICAALGGYEHVQVDGRLEMVYKLGDDCLGMCIPDTECLRDLRRLWRQDDSDSSRAVARVFAELGTLHNDLVPILLHTAGTGEKENKIALACSKYTNLYVADLMTALTWPIDWNAEVHDIVNREEEEDGVLSKLVGLRSMQVQYKASILRVRAKEPRLSDRCVIGCVMHHLLLPALSRPKADRSERDTGVIGMCLHLFRNLSAIRDPVAHTTSSATILANTTLQSLLVEQLDQNYVLDTLMMLASCADTKEYELWSPVTADCIYQLYVGSNVIDIATISPVDVQGTSHALSASLDSEAKEKRRLTNNARHSRFGTTIQFRAQDGSFRVARQQAALTEPIKDLEQGIADRGRRKVSRRRRAYERGDPQHHTAWTHTARKSLRRWADRFMQDGAFQTLEQQYLRDIHAERERVGDLDTARCKAMQIAAFFLDYFRARRATDTNKWDFSLIASWMEPWAFRLARSRAAMSMEAKQWYEFVAAIRLWTSLLNALQALTHGTTEQRQVADHLQNTLYYDGDLLDTSLQVMHAYSAQSFACLEAVLDFAYTMPRLLEKHASQHEYLFVKQRQNTSDEDTTRSERLFRFQTYQRAMATTKLAHLCTQYLMRWSDSAQPAVMLPRLASVTHRLVVKAERPGLFFTAKTRQVWIRLLRGGEQPIRALDGKAFGILEKLAHYISRQFSKLDSTSKEALDANRAAPRAPKANKVPAEICVRPELEHSEQIGVAVGLLAEEHKLAEVAWLKFHLELASAERKALMAHDPEADPEAPSTEIQDRFLEHHSEEIRTGMTYDPVLKLLLRLVGLEPHVDCENWRWNVPKNCTPAALDRDGRIIDQYLAQPLLMEGDLRDYVRRVRAPRERTAASEEDDGYEDQHSKSRKRSRTTSTEKAKRAPRIPRWLDNEFIEESDEELAFAMEDARPHTSSRSVTPNPLFTKQPSSGSPTTSPSVSAALRSSPLEKDKSDSVRKPAHRDPLFLFDSDNE